MLRTSFDKLQTRTYLIDSTWCINDKKSVSISVDLSPGAVISVLQRRFRIVGEQEETIEVWNWVLIFKYNFFIQIFLMENLSRISILLPRLFIKMFASISLDLMNYVRKKISKAQQVIWKKSLHPGRATRKARLLIVAVLIVLVQSLKFIFYGIEYAAHAAVF